MHNFLKASLLLLQGDHSGHQIRANTDTPIVRNLIAFGAKTQGAITPFLFFSMFDRGLDERTWIYKQLTKPARVREKVGFFVS
jgi:hypothetical protein